MNSYGVTLKKSTTAPLMLIALYSPHGTHDATYLANYAYINLNDPVARLYGVGQTQVFGSGPRLLENARNFELRSRCSFLVYLLPVYLNLRPI